MSKMALAISADTHAQLAGATNYVQAAIMKPFFILIKMIVLLEKIDPIQLTEMMLLVCAKNAISPVKNAQDQLQMIA